MSEYKFKKDLDFVLEQIIEKRRELIELDNKLYELYCQKFDEENNTYVQQAVIEG